MIYISLFPLVLMTSLHVPLAGSVAMTFKDTDPITGNTLECDNCAPGTYLRAKCTATRSSECAPCPPGSYTEIRNYIRKCLRCSVCGNNQRVKTECRAVKDTDCECKQGFYYKTSYDACLRHSECPSGQEVMTQGTSEEDTVCRHCPNSSFSSSPQTNCSRHQLCSAGTETLLRGGAWHDTVCGGCIGQDQGKDGASYLRQILPTFFVHQKIHFRHLRRIVRNLPGNTHTAVNSNGATTYDLGQRVNEWVEKATPEQIRQLPAILKKSGANGASERLDNKLTKIEANLKRLCVGNEVVDNHIVA